jgi:hypothetical protein
VQILSPKLVFGECFGMRLEGDCHEVEVTSNLELLITFGMSLEGVCYELSTSLHYKLKPNLEAIKNFLKKVPSQLGMINL